MDSQSILPFSPLGDLSSSETLRTGEIIRAQGESYRPATTIGILTDDVLLDIFDFYRENHDHSHYLVWDWHLLVHVCRRWRQIIFESPHRLKIQILCTHKTPVPKNLGIWPAFPLVIDYDHDYSATLGNVIAALGHSDRVCYVKLNVTDSQLAAMTAVMLEPFPVLTHLCIFSRHKIAPVYNARFLGGSAPCLQEITLSGVPYPALPTLLLSASGLVTLRLHNISPTGYISPEAMLACVAGLPRLKTLTIGFRSRFQPATLPDQIHPPPVTPIVLPALTEFRFKGYYEYLEVLVSHIDCPQLEDISIDYLHQLGFQFVQLSKFIDRSVGPFRHGHVSLLSKRVTFNLDRHANYQGWDRRLVGTTVSFVAIDWRVSQIARVLSQFSVALSTVVHLELKFKLDVFVEEATDNVEWLRLLRQFPAMQMLHVSRDGAYLFAFVLEDFTAEMVAEALPSLDLIYLESQSSLVEKFVAARRLSDHPVTVVDTRKEFHKRLESYISR